MIRSVVFASILSLFFYSCRQPTVADISYHTGNDIPFITLNDSGLKVPLTISCGDSGLIWYRTPSGKVFLQERPWKIRKNGHRFHAHWISDGKKIKISIEKREDCYTFSFTARPSVNILGWGFGIQSDETEYFTGLFERTIDGDQKESWKADITEAMNIRGQQVEMLIRPTLSLYCPFYLSSNGYGLFLEGKWPGKYNFCKTDPERVLIEFEGPSLEGRIYISKHPAEIVKAHSLYVGPTIVPPLWAFMPWRWRDNHVNRATYYDGTPVNARYNSQLTEDILMMKAFDIPCGVYWVDRPWAKGTHGYADFNWDPQRFPEAESMIQWLHNMDTRFLLWIAPWVTGSMRQEAYEKDYAQPLIAAYNIDSSNAALIDFTNPEAISWWQRNGVEKMLRQGVDGFKLDRAEENVPEGRDDTLHDGRTAREVRNEYPVLYVKAVNESCRKIAGDDFVLIPRAGYSGSSKYSGFWGGDIGSPAEGLRAAIIAIQRSSVIGFPVWGSDIGGYWQGDLDREVTARWLAFGCFNPIMEVGPTEDRAPWDMDSEPYYDTKLIAIWRLYATIHASLANYSHELVIEAHETGLPPVRPLFLIYPDQQESWNEWQSYLYGPDLLVHAIWRKGTDSATVYLPSGEQWRDAWDTDRVYEGGQKITIGTPLYKIPIFFREGSTVKLSDLNYLYNESLKLAHKKPDLKELERKYLNQKKYPY
jgi:alpha-D-xyloside xylohydrolase